MAYDLEEQEKLDALRAWWDRYGTAFVVLIFVVAAGVLGWRGWQWYQEHKSSQAMSYFEALENATSQPGEEALTRIKAASGTLRNDFPSSGYTPRGLLVAAMALQQRGDLDGAREQLEWLVKNSSDRAMVSLGKLRLAGVLLEQKQYEPALALLNDPPRDFAGLYLDRRGDILLAQGKKDDARAAWQEAIKALGSDPAAQIVQLKLDALSGA